MTADPALAARLAPRLAIEGLRAGVPNGEAIRRLGGIAEAIEHRFEAALDDIAGRPRPGMMIAGGFGSGKSHTLGYLRGAALHRNCVVSTIAVSKETPLNLAGTVLVAALRQAEARKSVEDPVALALHEVRRRAGAMQDLEIWSASPGADVAPLFSAMAHVLSHDPDADLLRACEAFLAGARPPTPAIRVALRKLGARGLFDLTVPKPDELARQRTRFLARLFLAAGFAGWVVLIDEVELIGRYGPLQRALAYVELARWLGLPPAPRVPGLLCVAAISDDFADRVINDKQDDEKLIERLRLRQLPDQPELARTAMRAIQEAAKLRPPDDDDLRRHAAAARACYRDAYGWEPPEARIERREKTRTMRHHVRGWITQWDMKRLHGREVGLVETTAATDYKEDALLTEAPAETDQPE